LAVLGIAMTDEKKIESLKLWYALFVSVIDSNEPAHIQLHNLRLIRERIAKESPDLDRMVKQ
jgi:hypothetical protein